MASDRKEFERASAKWQELHNDKAYSIPERLGKIAILVSRYQGMSSDTVSDYKEFTTEAMRLARAEKLCGNRPEVIFGATGSDFTNILRDPLFSSVVTIGHGALSYLYIENGVRKGELNDRYDWRDLSRDVDHLKSGVFVQRHCGHASRRLSVPLGSFAMQSHNWVVATANEGFYPVGLYDEDLKFLPTGHILTYEDVLEAYPYEDFLLARQHNEEIEPVV